MRAVRALLVVVIVAACSSSASPRLELVDAPPTKDVATLVAAERARALADGKQLLVYVGGTWCEPCKRFHDAAASGRLDDVFGQLRLLVFDADRDEQALVTAGYRFTMIPMFAVPALDGRSTGRRIEGSVKGEGAVDQITPRLRTLVER